jgi:hypothetical protein
VRLAHIFKKYVYSFLNTRADADGDPHPQQPGRSGYCTLSRWRHVCLLLDLPVFSEKGNTRIRLA